MQRIVIDEPYEFIPPIYGRFWPWVFRKILPWYLRRTYGLARIEVRHLERYQRSLDEGHGIIVSPNHCRPSDPLAIGWLVRLTGQPLFALASWHLFKQSRFQRFLVRGCGAFSIYREGVDRQAISTAINILAQSQRPLVVFPEGAVTRTNDLLGELQEGTAFLARSAAKRRAKEGRPGKIVIHPVAFKYFFRGDIQKAAGEVLTEIERRLTWQPRTDTSLVERAYWVACGLLALKELEYLGEVQNGSLFERRSRLVEHILQPLEEEWLPANGARGEANGGPNGGVVTRVKNIRAALLADMVAGKVDDEERARRWRILADVYLAQQLSLYPENYLRASPTVERLLETVERFEEDLTDTTRIYGPLDVVMSIGEVIEVQGERPRGVQDPLHTQLEERLRAMLAELEKESGPKLPLPEWMKADEAVAI
jgi:1-acyl-sn-glycerol-3-phosphate acyltransferase